MSDPPLLLTVDRVDPDELARFLERSFGAPKARFLTRHGAWWHRETTPGENRWAIVVGGEIAAYCAVVPGRCRWRDRERAVLWWIDLVVAPRFRGRGLQTLFDREVRRRAEGSGALLTGFPNVLAAAIHRRHGWGVREDLEVLLAPLAPRRLASVRRARGLLGALLRAGATALAPLAAVRRRGLLRSSPRGDARRLDEPEARLPATLAALARSTPDDLVTAVRDADQFAWRYLSSPVREQLVAYGAGSVGAVVRFLPDGGPVRVLDLFGALDDPDAVGRLAHLVVADAARAGAPQVTVAWGGGPRLAGARAALVRAGFLASTTLRFCWWPRDGGSGDGVATSDIAEAAEVAEVAEVADKMSTAPLYWCLGDSDNDPPD